MDSLPCCHSFPYLSVLCCIFKSSGSVGQSVLLGNWVKVWKETRVVKEEGAPAFILWCSFESSHWNFGAESLSERGCGLVMGTPLHLLLISLIQGKVCGLCSELQSLFCVTFSSKGNQTEISIHLNTLSTTLLGFFIAVFVLYTQSIWASRKSWWIQKILSESGVCLCSAPIYFWEYSVWLGGSQCLQ